MKIDDKKLHQAFVYLRENRKIELLYQQSEKLVKGIAFSIVKNQEVIEDISQDIFLKLLTLPIESLPTEKETSWLYSVVKNECFLYFRKQKPMVDIEELYDLPIENDEIEMVIEKEKFQQLICSLPEKEKQILSLKLISGFTFQEIAKLLDMPIGTVQWRYYKALHSIKAILSSLGGAVLTFLLGMGLWNNQKNFEKEIESNENESKNEAEIQNGMENGRENVIDENPKKENAIQENEINLPENQTQEEVVAPSSLVSEIQQSIMVGSFILSLVFLLIAIFFILTKKYQQKAKKKSSK